jgi:hypothetical protein
MSSIESESQALHGELNLLQNNLQQVFDDQTDSLCELISNFDQSISQEIINRIDAYAEQLSNIFDIKFSELEAAFFSSLADFQNTEKTKMEIATQWFLFLEDLWSTTISQLPIEKYFPDQIKMINDDISQSRRNIENGFYESGLVTVQNIIKNIEIIRNTIETMEIRQKYYKNICIAKLRELVELSDEIQSVPAIGIDGEDLGIDIDVAYWSKGRLKKVIGQIEALMRQVESQGDYLDIDYFKEILTKVIPKIKLNLEEAVYWARKNVLSSQIRYNIASSVVQALAEQGFLLSSGSYDNRDQRCFYQVHMKHIDGSVVLVEVKEIDGEVGASQLDMENLDAKIRSEHELRQRAKEVAISLGNYGLQVGRNLQKSPTPNIPQRAEKIGDDYLSTARIQEQQEVYGRH